MPYNLTNWARATLSLLWGLGTPPYPPDCWGADGRLPPLLCSPPLPHQNLALIVVGLGAVFSLIFHLGTKEKPYPPGVLPEPEESTLLLQKEPPGPPRPLLLWKDWLLEPSFYQVRLGRTPLAWGAALPGHPGCPAAMGLAQVWVGMERGCSGYPSTTSEGPSPSCWAPVP